MLDLWEQRKEVKNFAVKQIANALTFLRIILSILMIFCRIFSAGFLVAYLLCGITDVLDGFLARRLCTESNVGSCADSFADLLFAGVCACKMLPTLALPGWVWLWMALTAVIQFIFVLMSLVSRNLQKEVHGFYNRLAGAAIFICLPFIYHFGGLSLVLLCLAIVSAALAQRLFAAIKK